MKKLSTKQIERLQESIKWSQQQLKKPRLKRHEAVKQFVGHHYSEDGSDQVVPVNIIALATTIFVRQLAARAPRAMLTTKDPSKKPMVANFELAINQIPARIKLGATLQRMVMEGLFSWGIVKCGLHTTGQALGHNYGEPFVDIVTPDDYFVDMSADHMDNIDYEGNDYWMDFDEVKGADWVNKDAMDRLKPYEESNAGADNDYHHSSSNSGNANAHRYKQKIRLRDVWLPDEGILITMDIASKLVLNTVDWSGPERGPYIKLKYNDVPGALLPLPPVAIWRDIHDLANSLFRKLANQADGQKSVLGFGGGNDDSILAFKAAKDGAGINYQGAKPETLVTPGVDQKTLAFFMMTKDLGSYYAGNLDSLGGLGSQTDTVGQDKLIGEAASAQLRDMAQKTVEAAREIFSALAFYEWHDPIVSRRIEKPVPGMEGMTLPITLTPDMKKGDFKDFDLEIDVYSLQDDSPGLRLQKLGMVMQNYIVPLAPMIAQAGGVINAQKILETVARYADLPEMSEIVTFTDPTSPESSIESGGASAASKPANTTRTYERRTGGGPTRDGASRNMQQILMGGGNKGLPPS